MVLAGLVIALGEVVDDAIIDVENISRRLRLNLAAGSPESAFQVVLKASLEVRSAVVYASLIVVLVFVPVFFLDGLAGAFFRPLALAYVIAILASLIVALTVTPALSYMLLTGRRRETRDPPLARVLKRAYRRILPPLISRPWVCLIALVAAFVLSGLAAARLGQEFLPRFQETDFLMHFVEKPGTSLDADAPRHDARQPRLATLATRRARRSSATSVRTSAGRKSPTSRSARTSPNSGSASTRGTDYTQSVKKIEEVVYSLPRSLSRPAHLSCASVSRKC